MRQWPAGENWITREVEKTGTAVGALAEVSGGERAVGGKHL